MVAAETIKKLPAILKPVSDEQGANAAVALLLKHQRDDHKVLLVKRVENPSDPWSGQMALPGGKREPNDKSLQDTVTRETMEETGIALDTSSFLGSLTAITSEPKPGMKILPFVVLLNHEPKLKLNQKELERYLWVPYKTIVQSRGVAEFSFGKYSAYILPDAVVWGITYKILSQFIRAVKKAACL
ncbi:MAG: CoA pyrophosphatase [Candidatus Bathyarchaeota archaeon]|nr:CoA pyrophosphatase [Candidatus Bathyarchaeota archaeon]